MLQLGRTKKIACILFGVSAALVLSEIVLSVLPQATRYYVWPPYYHHTVTPAPGAFVGIEGPSRIIANSQGIRGDELSPEHTYRILTIGGSATACFYLDHAETWPYLLQEKLNEAQKKHKVWVGNAGASGRNSWHHIFQAKYLLNQYPDIDALMVLMGVNDFRIKLAQGGGGWVDLLDRSESEELLRESFYWFPVHRHEALPFYKRTMLGQLARPVTAQLIRFLKRGDVPPGNIQDDVGAWLDEARKRKQSATPLDHLPDLTAALEEYSVNINMLIHLARNKSVRIIFLTQPTLWRPGLPKALGNLCWAGPTYDGDYYSIGALATGMKKYNEKLLKICRIRQIECIDSDSLLAKDTSAFYDDAHLNESGAEKMAEILAHYLIRHEPFQEIGKDRSRSKNSGGRDRPRLL